MWGGDVSGGLALSCTVTENVDVPVPKGVPIIRPLAGFRTMPLGRLPLTTIQFLYGGVPRRRSAESSRAGPQCHRAVGWL